MRDSKHLPVFIFYFISFFFYCFSQTGIKTILLCQKKDAICFYNMLSPFRFVL